MNNKKIFKVVILLLVTALIVSGCNESGGATDNSQEDDTFPDKQITLYVPWSVGGSTDRAARLIAQYLEQELDANIIIENKPGAAGTIAAADVSRRDPDGYSLMYYGIDALTLGVHLVNDPMYSVDDFVPLYNTEQDSRFIFVNENSPFETMDDLIKYAKENPDTVSIAYTTGTGGQWITEYLVDLLDLPVNTVGYEGGGPATTALLGGDISAYVDGGSGRIAYKGELRPIGVISDEKQEPWLDAIPLVEQEEFIKEGIDSIPGTETSILNAIWAPSEFKEQYPERYEKLINALEAVKDDPDFQSSLEDMGSKEIFIWRGAEEATEIIESSQSIFEKYSHITNLLSQ